MLMFHAMRGFFLYRATNAPMGCMFLVRLPLKSP